MVNLVALIKLASKLPLGTLSKGLTLFKKMSPKHILLATAFIAVYITAYSMGIELVLESGPHGPQILLNDITRL